MDSWMLMILVFMPGVWSGDWGVTFGDQCALRGGSVVMKCSYDYPWRDTVTQVEWSRTLVTSGTWRLHPLSSLPSPRDFKYVGNLYHNCNLKINNVKPTDEGQYYFSFVTTSDKWTSKTYAYLFVKELTAVLKPSTVKEGDDFRLTCVSECPTSTTIVWFKDGQQVPTPGSPVRREDAGSYFCAVLGQETVRSNSVTLNVQYGPENISISVDDQQFTEGSSVNLTCSSVANPAADNYSWYKRTDSPSSSSWLQVGWGQVLSLPSVEASHTGLYLCQASNSVGTGNSTAQLVTLITEDRGSQIHVIIIARVGVFVLVTLVVARLLYWATIGKSEASTIYSTVVTSS
ncbi:unnamed protein product [Pleuronectes platessa]|uniref:Ig-like domain-containing protein n=1 Tax=Pleuronectes platessa TaxID=8262 RepID=A0A9N7TY68_PLEPL|nr:B-cell receptor CD22 isoform X1 [Pleuronectes platessa]XP_053288548.1 B-cell receptor CD22 isoform X1 [Pleuronectes platessa]CAB1420299.1 unnamed protein product [Pleuronectes platessa]